MWWLRWVWWEIKFHCGELRPPAAGVLARLGRYGTHRWIGSIATNYQSSWIDALSRIEHTHAGSFLILSGQATEWIAEGCGGGHLIRNRLLLSLDHWKTDLVASYLGILPSIYTWSSALLHCRTQPQRDLQFHRNGIFSSTATGSSVPPQRDRQFLRILAVRILSLIEALAVLDSWLFGTSVPEGFLPPLESAKVRHSPLEALQASRTLLYPITTFFCLVISTCKVGITW
jgi:hypothetical protein